MAITGIRMVRPLIGILLLLALTTGNSSDNMASSSYDPVKECSTFMAPSTLGNDDTNMGIYTAKPLKRFSIVNYPEINIPLLFREWADHKYVDYLFRDGELWDRYIWSGKTADIETYNDRIRNDNRAVFVPGIGCTV